MNKRTKLIIGGIVYLILFSLFAVKFNSLFADTIHEKLVNTTRDLRLLSMVNRLLVILCGFDYNRSNPHNMTRELT
jgi:hypothetical protein